MQIFREREEDLENLLNRGALWAVTYGDLMSYLMIFFLLLFVFSLTGGTAFEEGISIIQESFGGQVNQARIDRAIRRSQEEIIAKDVRQAFVDQGLQQMTGVEISEDRIRITLREPILFASGKAFLKPEAFPILHGVAEIMRNQPHPLMIEGHTDNVPVGIRNEYESNWQLSMARAYTVIRYFVDVEGLDPKRLSGVGYGEYQPVVPNTSTDNRARNRRIDISLLRSAASAW
ncbi:MAG TPA: OmpA family protein [Elusimicrobiota bacterium]|nr:OmpA family protein [Elusimicrobiota bacterium]